MNRYLRSALTAGAILLAVLIAAGIRALWVRGVFTSVTPGFAGTCSAIPSASGPEDIVIDEASGLAFVSASDVRARLAGKPSTTDGIYTLALAGPAKLNKTTGAPSDFHPHGISLYRDAGGLALMAVNHKADGHDAIETFDVTVANGTATLHHTGSIDSELLISANAIAAVDRARFYVSNDHGSTSAFGRTLEETFALPRANVLFFDGLRMRAVAEHMAFANGLALSPDRRYLYVAETYARRVDTFEIQPLTGSLSEAKTLDIPSGVDNLRFDAAGNLWVGAWPKGLAMYAYDKDPKTPAPSQVYKVTLTDGIPAAAELVFADDGHRIGGASVASVVGKRLLIGSSLDDHVLDCRLP